MVRKPRLLDLLKLRMNNTLITDAAAADNGGGDGGSDDDDDGGDDNDDESNNAELLKTQVLGHIYLCVMWNFKLF